MLRPGDATEARPRRPRTSSPDRGTSTRDDIFTGPSSPQPRSVQYAVISAKRGDLHVDDPLGRRDVAVEARDDGAHREAVVDRQRPAVHRDRQHRVAVVGERGERRAAGPAVLGGLQHRVGAGEQTRPRPRIGASRTPLHQALPIRSPPTSLLTQLRVTQASVNSPGEQVVVGQRDLALDHPVDPQRPVLRLDRRHHDRGVDPVEAVGRGHPAADALRRRGRRRPGTAGRVTCGSRSRPRTSSTCRRPRPTTRPTTPSTPAARDQQPGPDHERAPGLAATPVGSGSARRRAGLQRRRGRGCLGDRAAARSAATASTSQVTKPTATGSASIAAAAALGGDRRRRRPPTARRRRSPAPTSVRRASRPAQAKITPRNDEDAEQQQRLVQPADQGDEVLGDRPGRDPDDELGDRDHRRLADGHRHRREVAAWRARPRRRPGRPATTHRGTSSRLDCLPQVLARPFGVGHDAAGGPCRVGIGTDVHRLADGVPMHLAGPRLARRAAGPRRPLRRRRRRARDLRRPALGGRARRPRASSSAPRTRSGPGPPGVALLEETARRVRAAGFEIGNAAVQVIGEPAHGSAPRRAEAQAALGRGDRRAGDRLRHHHRRTRADRRGEGVAALATALLLRAGA